MLGNTLYSYIVFSNIETYIFRFYLLNTIKKYKNKLKILYPQNEV